MQGRKLMWVVIAEGMMCRLVRKSREYFWSKMIGRLAAVDSSIRATANMSRYIKRLSSPLAVICALGRKVAMKAFHVCRGIWEKKRA